MNPRQELARDSCNAVTTQSMTPSSGIEFHLTGAVYMYIVCRPSPMLQLLLCWLYVTCAACTDTFLLGNVYSSKRPHTETLEARDGYKLFVDTFNRRSQEPGFILGGTNGTKGYHFKFKFVGRDNLGNDTLHDEKVTELVEDGKVHFLGGSHPHYASNEMEIANASGVLNYHCCVGPDEFYAKDYRTVFGIQASNREYTKVLIRSLGLHGVKRIAFINDRGNTFTRTTCEAGIKLVTDKQVFAEGVHSSVYNFTHRPSNEHSSRDTDQESLNRIAQGAKSLEVEAVVACVFPSAGTKLVRAFHKVRHPLKSFFLTTGPAKRHWLEKLRPKFLADDLLSAGQWHHELKYSDQLFSSTEKYAELYRQSYPLEPTYLAAGASAVGVTLWQALKDAFSSCDISKTEGDVEALLRDKDAITCADGQVIEGYDRVLNALMSLDVETFFGRVVFNHLRRNVGLTTVTTQYLEAHENSEKPREIKVVFPSYTSTGLLKFPGANHYKERCSHGHFVGPNAFEPCVPCQPGMFSDRVDAPDCDKCPIGQWTDLEGQEKCKKCPAGTFTEERGAEGVSDCVCMPGYYNALGKTGAPCERCMDGAECAGGRSLPVPLPNHWAAVYVRERIYQCDSPSICLGGGASDCARGYTGRLCSECEDGYFSVIQQCQKCWTAVKIVFVSAGLLLLWYVLNVIVSRSVSSLEMMLGWAQLANIIGDINLNWTKTVTTMFSVANFLDFDVDILEPSCLFTWGFKHNFLTQLCLPVVMTTMGCSGYLGSAAAFYVLKHDWIRLDGRRQKLLSYFIKVPENEEELKEKLDTTIATFLASVDVTYVTVAKYCFDVFKCREIAGVSVLRVAPEVLCHNPNHGVLKWLALGGIIVYVTGFPCWIFWKLYDLHRSRAFDDPKNLRRYGFIYEKYELDYFYTPAIIVVRKLLFVLVLVFVNNPAFQIGAIAVIIIVSLMIHVYTTPYVDTYLDVLFNFLLLTLMSEAFGGLMFSSEQLKGGNREILEWIVMIFLFVLITVFLMIFAREIVLKHQIWFIRELHQQYADPKKLSIFAFLQRKIWKFEDSRPQSMLARASKESISYELLETFDPSRVYHCLLKDPHVIKDWDKMTQMLKPYVSDESITSYLSTHLTAKFWRKLVNRFPEIVDFLAVTDNQTREQFVGFARQLYRHFYLSNKVVPLPLMKVLNWRDHAPIAQWLATADGENRQFFVQFVSQIFEATGNTEAAESLLRRLENNGADPCIRNRQTESLFRQQDGIRCRDLDFKDPFFHPAKKRTARNLITVCLTLQVEDEERSGDEEERLLHMRETQPQGEDPESEPADLLQQEEVGNKQDGLQLVHLGEHEPDCESRVTMD